MSSEKLRTYYVVRINCDCAADIYYRTSRPRWTFGPRCRGCGRLLGPMQWSGDGTVRAANELEASRKYHARVREEIAEKRRDGLTM